MEALYHQTNKQIQDVQSRMGSLESAPADDRDESAAHRLENDLLAEVDHVFHQLGRLETMKSREPPLRRQNAKRLVDQLAHDARHLKEVLGAFRRRRVGEAREREREELLSRTFTANDAHTSITMTDDDDGTLRQNAALHGAHKDIDDILDSGGGVLGSLRDQRGALKGTHKRMLDVANMLGLSATVMRFVERRAAQDGFLMVGGMLLTCLFMFLVIWYLG